jgi:hypothetical protein
MASRRGGLSGRADGDRGAVRSPAATFGGLSLGRGRGVLACSSPTGARQRRTGSARLAWACRQVSSRQAAVESPRVPGPQISRRRGRCGDDGARAAGGQDGAPTTGCGRYPRPASCCSPVNGRTWVSICRPWESPLRRCEMQPTAHRTCGRRIRADSRSGRDDRPTTMGSVDGLSIA